MGMHLRTESDSVTVRTIDCCDAWDKLAPDWSALLEISPQSSAPLHQTWLRTWWRVYEASKPSPLGLRIISVWRNSNLIGILPLCDGTFGNGPFAVRRLGFLSTGEVESEETCPDYLNLLCLAGEEMVCLNAVTQAVKKMRWDYLELLDVPEGSPLLNGVSSFGAAVEVIERGACPIANMEDGFESYLKRLTHKTRQHARQYLRAADRANAVFDLATGPDADQFFDDLVRLHQERWTLDGKSGCFASRRFTEFHRALAKEWIPTGQAVLARLSVAGKAIAVLYGFISRSKFDFYQSGVKHVSDGPMVSPGTTAILMLMSKLSAMGVTRFDFLRGSSSYKERLATEHCRLFAIRVWRPTIRSLAYRSSKVVGRVLRRRVKRRSIIPESGQNQ